MRIVQAVARTRSARRNGDRLAFRPKARSTAAQSGEAFVLSFAVSVRGIARGGSRRCCHVPGQDAGVMPRSENSCAHPRLWQGSALVAR